MTLSESQVRSLPLAGLPCVVTSSLLPPHLGKPSAAVYVAGNLDALAQPTTALFCSSQCPGSVILRTFDRMTAMRDRGEIVMGGFHSPMEHDCLRILLRGHQPVVLVLARALHDMRISPELQMPFREGRLLLLSPFEAGKRRVTALLAMERNRFAASIAANVLVAHAAPGSRTARLMNEIRRSGKPVLEVISLS
jgi:predicted Rossmann fold nucleotide-binding protein DprA/Smf involved in DNA uptake